MPQNTPNIWSSLFGVRRSFCDSLIPRLSVRCQVHPESCRTSPRDHRLSRHFPNPVDIDASWEVFLELLPHCFDIVLTHSLPPGLPCGFFLRIDRHGWDRAKLLDPLLYCDRIIALILLGRKLK